MTQNMVDSTRKIYVAVRQAHRTPAEEHEGSQERDMGSSQSY